MVLDKIDRLLKMLENDGEPTEPTFDPLPSPPPAPQAPKPSEEPTATASPDPTEEYSDLSKANDYIRDADKYVKENRVPLALHHIGDAMESIADSLMKLGKGEIAAKLKEVSKGLEFGGNEREQVPEPPESDPGSPPPTSPSPTSRMTEEVPLRCPNKKPGENPHILRGNDPRQCITCAVKDEIQRFNVSVKKNPIQIDDPSLLSNGQWVVQMGNDFELVTNPKSPKSDYFTNRSWSYANDSGWANLLKQANVERNPLFKRQMETA
jgi:hypothetical protein